MGFLFQGLAIVSILLGLGTSFLLQATTVPGAGVTGQAFNLATTSAQSMARFATACLNTASANPGLISSNLGVSMASGLSASFTAPPAANCMTATAPGGGRYVYASAKMQPGEGGNLVSGSQGSALWFRVTTQAQAVSLTTGLVSSVPAGIPAGSVLNWSQIAN